MDEYEKKKRQEELAKKMKERWAANAPDFQKGFLDDEEEKKKKSQWSNLKSMFGG